MEPALRVALEAVHASPVRAVLHVTGGAAQSLGWVMAVPGASRTLLEARVPYAREAMVDLLGHEPKQYVSPQTARDMARVAYKRGVRLTPPGQSARHVVGVGSTCALASVPPKRGEHRCVVAAYGVHGVVEYTLAMEKGRRDRWDEDGLASRLVVQALADAAADADADAASVDVATPASRRSSRRDLVDDPNVLGAGDSLTIEREPIVDPIEWLTSGAGDLVELTDGVPTAIGAVPPNALVLPGSFNPLHDGHRGVLAAASRVRPGCVPAYELAVTNADKGTLPVEEVRRRAAQFTGDVGGDFESTSASTSTRLIITRAPLFATKAALMPGATFVIGQDTAIRLVMPKYYGGEARMMRAFEEIRAHGCSFVVAGRAGHPPPGETKTRRRRGFSRSRTSRCRRRSGISSRTCRGFDWTCRRRNSGRRGGSEGREERGETSGGERGEARGVRRGADVRRN